MMSPSPLSPRACCLRLAFVGWAVAFTPCVLAGEPNEKPESKSEFIRLIRDQKKQPQALQTAVVSFVPRDCGKTSPTVDLVAALHVADRAYYEELNRLFAKYDAVLYELIAPEGTRIPAGTRAHYKTGGARLALALGVPIVPGA